MAISLETLTMEEHEALVKEGSIIIKRDVEEKNKSHFVYSYLQLGTEENNLTEPVRMVIIQDKNQKYILKTVINPSGNGSGGKSLPLLLSYIEEDLKSKRVEKYYTLATARLAKIAVRRYGFKESHDIMNSFQRYMINIISKITPKYAFVWLEKKL